MFTEHVSSILYCYGVYQSYFNEMKVPNLEFHEGLPSHEKVETLNDGKLLRVLKLRTYLQSTVIIIISQLFFYLKIFLHRVHVPELLT